MKCKCCSKVTCSNCGFINIAVLDDAAEKNEMTRIDEHRKKIISAITEFSIDAYIYKWNSSMDKLEERGREKAVIANGMECHNKIIWSIKSFGQNLDEKYTKRPVEIKYLSKGKEKSFTAELKTVKCFDFWKLGLEIHDDFTVTVYLGNENNHSKAGPFSLELN